MCCSLGPSELLIYSGTMKEIWLPLDSGMTIVVAQDSFRSLSEWTGLCLVYFVCLEFPKFHNHFPELPRPISPQVLTLSVDEDLEAAGSRFAWAQCHIFE